MDASFWHERWAQGRIAFHEGHANSYLARFADRLDGAARVLVPLCGKTEDLAYLAGRGHQVVGLELVEDAVRAFFSEHGLAPEREERGPHVVYTAGAITLIAGDALTVPPDVLGAFDAIFDRAALVALPPDMRKRYVARLRELAPPGARVLLVAIEYTVERDGPPFAVFSDEVRALYAGARVEELASGPDPRPRDELPGAIERCYAITL